MNYITGTERMLSRIAGLVLLVLLPASVRGQQSVPPAWPQFLKTFDAAMDTDRTAGAAVVLVRDGRIIAHHERGLADVDRKQKVDERTLFHYGSITKTLTAIAIMQLRDRGRLSLDDKITRYIPELRTMHDPYGMMDSITLRMLLSHSAGFRNGTWPYGDGKPWEPFEPTTWNQLVAMMPYQELLFRPGSKYSYSNPGFVYLARVVEQLTGDPWEAYVQKNIFAPLGMTRSYFNTTPYYLANDRANSYAIRQAGEAKDTTIAYGREFNPGITIPNGGWNAPLADLATYLGFLTNAAGADSVTRSRYDVVLARASLQEMWRPQVASARDGVGMTTQSMGLSFFIVERNGARVIGHTGSQAGFLAFLYFNPATKTGVIAAFNTNNETRGARSGFRAANDAALELLK